MGENRPTLCISREHVYAHIRVYVKRKSKDAYQADAKD